MSLNYILKIANFVPFTTKKGFKKVRLYHSLKFFRWLFLFLSKAKACKILHNCLSPNPTTSPPTQNSSFIISPPFVSTAVTVAFSDSPSILQLQSIWICCSLRLEPTFPLNFHGVSVIIFLRSLQWPAYLQKTTHSFSLPSVTLSHILLYNSGVLYVTHHPLTYTFIGYLFNVCSFNRI